MSGEKKYRAGLSDLGKYSAGSLGYDTGNPRTQQSGYAGGLGGSSGGGYDHGRYGNFGAGDQSSYRTSQLDAQRDPRDALRDLRSQYFDREQRSQTPAYESLRNQMQAHDSLREVMDRGGGLPPTSSRSQTSQSRYGQYGDPSQRTPPISSRTAELSTRPQRPPDNVRTQRYEAVERSSTRQPDRQSRTTRQIDSKEDERRASRRNMERSFAAMEDTHARQQPVLAARPAWKNISIRDAQEPDELTVTHINQTQGLYSPELLDAKFSETMSSEEWLKTNSIASMKLTLKDLVDKGKIGKPDTNPVTKKVRQHVQFEANEINEFEYKLNTAIELYTKRIKWLLQGSRRYFGMVKGSRVGVMIDVSDSNCGFGRLSSFQEALTHLLDEQLSKKKGLYLQCFGTEPLQLWNDALDLHCRSANKHMEEAKQWIDAISPSGGTNLLKALKVMFQRKDIDSILLIVGSTPDQPPEVIVDYIDQLGAGQVLPIQTVAYDCSNQITMGALQKLADNSGGRFHCYASTNEDLLYSSTDVATIVTEIKKAQEVIGKVKEMRQGMLGTALVSVLNEITSEVAKLPQSRFLPRPPGHELPLNIEVASFQPAASIDWLNKHGLKGKNLDLYQVLAPNAYSFMEEFIPVIRKTVHSHVHESAMAQFEWHDGTMKNVHVDMTQLFEYQKQLGSTVKLYEKRIDWLSSASRKIFGTVTENRVIILVDLSISNLNYLVHIQHSIRLLLEQQMANKDFFNIIGFGSEAKPFRPTMVKPSPENLQAAWQYTLDMQCGGSRNFMAALRLAVENDEETKHDIESEGVYLFTSGIPDQQSDQCYNYVEEAAAGRNLKVHVALFNVDDYDAHGAIPSRYANITKTAECLRNLAHCSGGRFHWFRETGIIESDDIAAINLEIEKSLNFSKKCSMLVNSVKKKYGINDSEMKALPAPPSSLALPSTEPVKPLPPPKHTALTQARVERAEVTEASKTLFRPSSASSSRGDGDKNDPMARVKGKRVQKAFFFTEDNRAQVGSVFRKYPMHKPKPKPIKAQSIPDREEQMTTKEWLRKYSLQRLKLNLNKIVSTPETRQTTKPVKIINKTVEAKVFRNFPTISVNGQMQYLQLQPRELQEYQHQVRHVLNRYIHRLQWLLSGSRRIFSTVVEKKCVFLIDTSGSMDLNMEELKKELASLIWDQLHKYRIKFNLIQFSRNCEQWASELVEPTEENCHRAIKWVSQLRADGNTCTLEALELAFTHLDLDAVYLLTDGKPDTSTSLVLKEVTSLNNNRGVAVNTISFNCEDTTANTFLKSLSAQTGGRYHRCHSDFDASKVFAHKLLSEEATDDEYPPLPDFEGEDLKKIGAEIKAACNFLTTAKQYRIIQENHQRDKSEEEDRSKVTVGPGRPRSAKV